MRTILMLLLFFSAAMTKEIDEFAHLDTVGRQMEYRESLTWEF